jgi:predicted tellurium resistance membrane protein TerC
MTAMRRGGVLFGLLLAGWAVAAPPGTPPAPPPADGYEADVLLADGTKLEKARVHLPVLKIGAEFGLMELDPRKVKVLDLNADEDGAVGAVAGLGDKTQQRGPLLTEAFAIDGPDGRKEYKAAEVAQIKFRHPKDLALVAVLLGLLTLTLMEIILGVDNVVLLSIYVGKLPPEQQKAARYFGLGGALVTRLLLLATLSWLVGLTRPVIVLPNNWFGFLGGLEARGISWRDVILLSGGLYLIYSSVMEMREKVESVRGKTGHAEGGPPRKVNFWTVIAQLAVVDIVFSLDSVITAIGMVDELWVMVAAVLISVSIMLMAAKPIGDFVNRRPTVKILALSFLLLIGALLVAEALGQHLDKGYIYFAMAFAVGVELVNSKLR